jgi:CheY-like chemotaxis protein
MTKPTAPILLVEDDPLLRHAFRLLLEDAGYSVVEAGTAADAVRVALERVPSLILLDLGLPDRPGLDVARELSGHPSMRPVPIVALTGRVGTDQRQDCLAAGCSHFLAKPIEPRELLRRMPELLAAD